MSAHFVRLWTCAAALLLNTALSNYAHADTFNISWDNDLLLGLDQGYTNGVRLAYLTSPSEDTKAVSASISRAAGVLFEALPGLDPGRQRQAVPFGLR